MSQLPNTLENGAPSANRRVQGGQDTPRVPEIGAPSYRESFIPLHAVVDTQGSRMAAQLQQDLALAGHDVSMLGEMHLHEVQQAQHEADKAEAVKAESHKLYEVAQHGIGANQARLDLPAIHDEFVTSKRPMPLDEASVPKMVDEEITNKTAGMSPEAAQAYRDRIAPTLENWWYGYRDRQIEAAQKQTLGYGREAAVGQTDPAKLSDIAQKMEHSGLGITPEMALHEVVSSAASNAARSARLDPTAEEQFKAAEAAGGKQFPDIFTRLRPSLEEGMRQRQGDIDKNFVNDAAAFSVGNDADNPAARVVSFPMQRAQLIQEAQRVGVSDHVLRAELNRVSSAEKEQSAKANATLVKNDLTAKFDGYKESIYQHMRGAAETGGAATIRLEDEVPEKVKDLHGVEHVVPVKQYIQEGIDRGMKEIDPDVPLTTVTPARVKFLDDNNAVYTPWQQVMRAGSNVTPTDAAMNADPATGKPKFSASTLAGYQMAQQMMQQDSTGTLLKRMLGNPKSELFYQTALMSAKWDPQGADEASSATAAIGKAAMGLRNTEPLGDESKMTMSIAVHDALSKYSSAVNFPDVRSEGIRLAEYLHRTSGAPLQAAGEAAAKMIESRYQMVGKTAVDTGNASLPRDNQGNQLFPGYAAKVIDQYMKNAGERAGLHKDALAVLPTNMANSFAVYNTETLSLVPNWRTHGFFTTSDITRDWVKTQQEKGAKAQSEWNAAATRTVQQSVPSGDRPVYTPGGPYGPPAKYGSYGQ